MKTTMRVILMACVLCFASCKKKEGPKGDTGPAGNANVSSAMVKVASSQWNLVNQHWEAAIGKTDLTDEILSTAAVSCYWIVDEKQRLMPYTNTTSSEAYVVGASLKTGIIVFELWNTGQPVPRPTGDYNFKVVIIPKI